MAMRPHWSPRENPFFTSNELEMVGLKPFLLGVICVVISELTSTTWQMQTPLLALLRDKE